MIATQFLQSDPSFCGPATRWHGENSGWCQGSVAISRLFLHTCIHGQLYTVSCNASYLPPNSIYDSPWRRTLLILVQSCCWILKTWAKPWKFRFMYTSWDVCNCSCASHEWRPCLIYRLRRRQRVFTLVLPRCWTPKMWGIRWYLVAIYKQADIYDIAYALPVNGGHLRFISHPDIGEYPHNVRPCCWTSKMG